jgi:hypothetical protein
MSVILDKFSFFYIPIPKVACTSIKLMFFELENGFPFKGYMVNGKRRHIHQYYGSSLWENTPHKRVANFQRVTLVRDPVERFLSAYSNRVVHHKELSPEKTGPNFKNKGLEYNPGLDLFIERFEDYYDASGSIFHHMRPMVDFLGEEASYFSKVYNIKEINQFLVDIIEHVGVDLTIGQHQKGGPKLKKENLTEPQLMKIESFYKKDYRAFHNYF